MPSGLGDGRGDAEGIAVGSSGCVLPCARGWSCQAGDSDDDCCFWQTSARSGVWDAVSVPCKPRDRPARTRFLREHPAFGRRSWAVLPGARRGTLDPRSDSAACLWGFVCTRGACERYVLVNNGPSAVVRARESHHPAPLSCEARDDSTCRPCTDGDRMDSHSTVTVGQQPLRASSRASPSSICPSQSTLHAAQVLTVVPRCGCTSHSPVNPAISPTRLSEDSLPLSRAMSTAHYPTSSGPRRHSLQIVPCASPLQARC